MAGLRTIGCGRAPWAFTALGLALLPLPLAAQTAERDVVNPPLLPAEEAGLPAAQKLVMSATAAATAAHERVLDLDIVYTDGQIFNPATGVYDKVHLRSYQGTKVDPTAPYVSPTIEAVPGDTIRVNLNNELPADPGCGPMTGHMPNKPHCFNGTNLHAHGLWVNPSGNGDNVLLSINPGVSFQYEYNIPGDHPSGTFWYHTHRHGSTALQVSSGMAGALIIRSDRLPTPLAHGDVDTLVKTMPERVLVMQQIQYACREPRMNGVLGPIKLNKDKTYRCDPGDVGAIEGYDLFAPGQWAQSGRYTTLNGVVLPTFHATQGKIERWRMIHAGVRDTISLTLVKMKPDVELKGKLSEAASVKFIKQSCTGAVLPYNLIAADGLTMGAAQQTKLATFQPGYRFDALIVFPEAGNYCLIDASSPGAGSVNGDTPGPRLMGIVSVAPGTAVPDIGAYVTDALVARAKQAMLPEMKAAIVADLQAGLKLTRFTPHPDIADNEVTGQQELTFFIDTSDKNNTRFEVGNSLKVGDVQPYDPDRIDRKLILGGVDEWTMQSQFASHPFHIHVNPFQIVSIIDPTGKDVSLPGSVDNSGGVLDPQYAGLKGVWKDTLWIKTLAPTDPTGIYTIKVRTRYQRYIGEFVLHCHILDHEDQGMMQNVAVVLGDGKIALKAAEGAKPMEDMAH
uniref:multicopper oxidase family protein n=1 Tax=Sphingomonas bacterium TaxID=1895847 RepID=UPI00260D07A2|nr:multicopper oxidase family protein [Sphingomonas bacterium]